MGLTAAGAGAVMAQGPIPRVAGLLSKDGLITVLGVSMDLVGLYVSRR